MSESVSFPTDDRDESSLSKRELRSEILRSRRAMPPEEQDGQDAGLRSAVASWLREVEAATVAAYVPMAGEPGGFGLLDVIAAVVERVLLPVVQPDRDLDWTVYAGPDALAPAGLGLTEPTGPRLGPTSVTRADVVIVPALAVDRFGTRLGRGGGSYDRALARISERQHVIALLYAGELRAELPAQPHDRRVHGVAINGKVTLLSPGNG
jgi:5-formyltetrahydrofolate cyclo-ligase